MDKVLMDKLDAIQKDLVDIKVEVAVLSHTILVKDKQEQKDRVVERVNGLETFRTRLITYGTVGMLIIPVMVNKAVAAIMEAIK